METYNQIGQQDKGWEGSDDQFNEGRMQKRHSAILYFLTWHWVFRTVTISVHKPDVQY